MKRKMTMNSMRWMSGVVLAMAIVGCGGNNDANNNYLPMNRRNVTPEATERASKALTVGRGAKVSAASTDFGFRLFSRMVGKEATQNLFISPASISTVLAMTYNGAAGSTKDAFESTLGVKGFLPNEVNGAYKDLRTLLLAPDPKVEISIANGIWTQQGVEFKRDFIGRNTDFYGAKVSAIDFSNPESLKTINDWVKEETEERIPKLFDELSKDAAMVLVNAVSFTGEWSEPFKDDQTKEDTFTGFDGKPAKAQMMNRNGEMSHLKEGKFAAVNLPYGDGKAQMTILLPNPNVSIPDLLKDVNAKNWTEWQGKFKSQRGRLSIPKFTFTSDEKLNGTLSGMGLGVAFDPQKADFSGMIDKQKLFISQAVHRTFVSVDEKGTEAAAATGVEMMPTSAPAQTMDFIANRPFVFVITEKSTGTVLFMGVFGKP